MKKIYALPAKARSAKAGLLALCLIFSVSAFSQRKPEFGFVVKGGNYAIPFKKTAPNSYLNGATTRNFQKAGSNYSLGLWQSLPLGNHFQLSGELLYRLASFSTEQHFKRPDFGGGDRSDQIQKISESSLSIPINLHYFFKKGGKSSIAIGGGVSRIFSTNIYTENKSQFDSDPETYSAYTLRFSNETYFGLNLNLNAGFHYQFNPKTSIGLEYVFQKTSEAYHQYPNVSPNIVVDCFCLYIEPETRPNMNSFSVSLRHNILK